MFALSHLSRARIPHHTRRTTTHSLTSLSLFACTPIPLPPQCPFNLYAEQVSGSGTAPSSIPPPIPPPSLLQCPPCRRSHARALQAAGPRLWALFPDAHRYSAGAHPRDREYAWAGYVSCAGEGACSSSERRCFASRHPHFHPHIAPHPHFSLLTSHSAPLTSTTPYHLRSPLGPHTCMCQRSRLPGTRTSAAGCTAFAPPCCTAPSRRWTTASSSPTSPTGASHPTSSDGCPWMYRRRDVTSWRASGRWAGRGNRR